MRIYAVTFDQNQGTEHVAVCDDPHSIQKALTWGNQRAEQLTKEAQKGLTKKELLDELPIEVDSVVYLFQAGSKGLKISAV